MPVLKLAKNISDNELRNGILQQVKGNPEITAEELAANFEVTVAEAQAQLEWLISKELLVSDVNGFVPTKKGLSKKGKTKTVYTEYHYDLRSDVPPPVIKATTRDFCREMYSVYADGKTALSFEAINKLKNEFGDNAFDYRGGFYNDGLETTPWCRHVWIGETKIKEE